MRSTTASRHPVRTAALALAFGVVASGCAVDEPAADLLAPSFSSHCPGPGCGSVVVDQVSPFDPAPAFTLAIGGQSDQILAQTITPGVSGQLVAVELPVGCANGQLIVDILDIAADGRPGTTVLRSMSVAAADLAPVVSPAEGYQSIAVAPPLRIVAGSPFALALSTTGTSCGILTGDGADPYAGGHGYDDSRIVPHPAGWRRFNESIRDGVRDSDDLPFRTLVRALPFGG